MKITNKHLFTVFALYLFFMVIFSCEDPAGPQAHAEFGAQSVTVHYTSPTDRVMICTVLFETPGECPCTSRQGEIKSSCDEFDIPGPYRLTNNTIAWWAETKSCGVHICTRLNLQISTYVDGAFELDTELDYYKGIDY